MTRPLFNRRIARAAAIGVALLLGCLLRTAPAGATTFAPMTWSPGQTVVSLEFDDGSADQYQLGPMLASRNMHATFFINSGLEINSYHMTWSQIHDLYSQGNEIGGHTVLHSDLATQSSDEATREICNDRATLLNEGFPVTDFAYPYGSFTSTTISQVQQCGYDSARTVSGILSPNCETSSSCPYSESIPPANPYLTRTPQNILTTDTLANIEGYVTQAQQHGGGWVQLVLHHICEDACSPYAITPSNLSAFLDWLSTQQGTTTATVQQVLGGTVAPAVPGPAAVNLPGPNLVRNPSLETEGNGGPQGYETNSYGANSATFTQTTDAHSGQIAERVQLSNYSSGEAWLASKMDLGEYAPTPTAGDNYDLNAYYKSSAPALFTIYTRNAKGEWTWWLNSGFYAASSSWTKATYTTPPVPAGVTGISIGLGIQAGGSLTVDDYALLDRGVIPPATNTLSNPALESLASGTPVCWSTVSSAGVTGAWTNTSDSHGGASAELANASAYSSGDMKLVSQQDATLPNPTLTSATPSSGGSLAPASYYYKITATTAYGQTLPSNEVSATASASNESVVLKWPAITSGSLTGYKVYRATAAGEETLLASVSSTTTSYTDNGSAIPGIATPPASNTASKVSPCAPSATPGDTYQGSAWYKSSAGASVRLVVYYRDATGNWVFWKTQPVAASTAWTQAVVNTDPVPPGATALSFGVSLFSAGTLDVDDLSLGDLTLASASDPPPCGSDVCDGAAPASSASSPAYSATGSFSVSYSAADAPSGSGLGHVDLYVKGPSDFGYTLVASNPGYATSGVFSYAALEGDGPYSFYTVATDAVGNTETAPLGPESTTVVDSAAPTSTASAPALTNAQSLTVAYTAADATSGVAEIDLYAQAPGQSGYAKVASDTSGSASGSLSFVPSAGNGTYNFYTLATDRAGNVQAAPASPETSTLLDAAAPSSSASSPAYSNSQSFSVSYSAADGSDGSGLARVDLYAQTHGQGYTLIASDTSGSASGSFAYTGAKGDGAVSFYTIATDQAGNVQATPSSPNTTTVLDTAAPNSKAAAPASLTYGSISVSYTAADDNGGSGLASVDLYAQAPGQSGYTLIASDASGSASGSFSYAPTGGDGTYAFYTIATDKAGNVQAAPGKPDASTSYTLDTFAATSQASAPANDYASSFTVAYTAADSGGSGLERVDLYAQAPGQSGYTLVASDASGSASGGFTFVPSTGTGTYNFYTLATDKAGNAEAAPAGADASTNVNVDAVAPSASASSPTFSASQSFSVSYAAADDAGGSGLAHVDLYAKAPGQSSYAKVASDASGASSGSFAYTAAAGDGSYSFYALATDKAGNVEAAPAAADSTTLLDTAAPSAKASAPSTVAYGTIPVAYVAADKAGGSGLARVDLYAKAPGQAAYAKVASDASGASSGSFSYAPAAGNGTYSFYAIATDKVGNVQATPANADASTSYTLDVTAPASTATAPAYANTTTWTVSYAGSDNNGGSGLASVELWARSPGTTTYVKAATNTTGAVSGTFSYAAGAGEGEGSYAFYTIAVDKAGNRQAAPKAANATTVLDTVAPGAFQMAAPAQYLRGSVKLSLSNAPADSGSGVASVSYQYRAGGSANAWSTACTATSSPWSCNWNTATAATPDGAYELRALAADRAGNSTLASNTPLAGFAIMNTPPTAKSVSTTNVTGGTVGKAETGDSMTFTYSTTMSPGSILDAWSGAATAVQVKFVAKNTKDTTLAVWNSAGTVQLALANPLDLGAAYVSKDVTFNATMVQNGAAITVTLGSAASGSVTTAIGGTVTWTPSNKATDLAGNKCSTTTVSALGPAF